MTYEEKKSLYGNIMIEVAKTVKSCLNDESDYDKKKSLYEKIMTEVAKLVKRRLNESNFDKKKSLYENIMVEVDKLVKRRLNEFDCDKKLYNYQLVDFKWKQVPNGRKNYQGEELYDYILINPDEEKYCDYDAKYYFIVSPDVNRKKEKYRIVEGHMHYDKHTFSLVCVGEFVNNKKYFCKTDMNLCPRYGDDIGKKFFSDYRTPAAIAIFETLSDAQKVCDILNDLKFNT